VKTLSSADLNLQAGSDATLSQLTVFPIANELYSVSVTETAIHSQVSRALLNFE
jgi:hypothetical protein